MSKYTFAFLFLTSLFVSFVALLAWQAAVVAQPESEPPLALPAAPLAPLSSYRRVQNLDPTNTAFLTATVYKQDGSVQTTFNATANPYRSALIDNGRDTNRFRISRQEPSAQPSVA